jgi:hypothetical protein
MQNVTCTGKRTSPNNEFTGCTITAAIPPKTAVTATVWEGTYSWVATTVTTNSSNIAVPTPPGTVNIPVSNHQGFSKRFFWLNSTDLHPTPQNSVLVSCTGYTETLTTSQLLGCSWSGNAAPAGSYTLSTNQPLPVNTTQVSGFIKIEMQNAAGVWSDVTMEILNLGISANNQEGTICNGANGDPNPNAIIRLQRLRDNGGGTCDYFQSLNPYDYWPNQLYDTREGNFRQVANTGSGSGMRAGGVMGYVTLDVANLTQWFAGTIGANGNNALNNNG